MGCKLRVTHLWAGLILVLPVLLTSASGRAADRPRDVTVHLDYERSPAARQCPAENALTDEVGAELGVERFKEAGPWRLHATIDRRKTGKFVATADLFDSDGALVGALGELDSPDCQTLVRAVAVWTALKLTDPPIPPPRPATLAVVPPETLAATTPSPPSAPPPELRTPPAHPASPPEPPSLPNPARTTARNVAIAAYVAAGTFLGLGIAWSEIAQSKANHAQALSAQPNPVETDSGCGSAGAPGQYCTDLLGAWQSRDAALNLRNGWFAAAGVSAAVGAVATAWALNLPTVIKGQPQTQVTFRPGGLVFSGTY